MLQLQLSPKPAAEERSGAQTAHRRSKTFPPRAERPLLAGSGTRMALIEGLQSNLAGSQQCIPLPYGGPKLQQAVVTGSQGEKHAKHDDLQTPRID